LFRFNYARDYKKKQLSVKEKNAFSPVVGFARDHTFFCTVRCRGGIYPAQGGINATPTNANIKSRLKIWALKFFMLQK